MFKEFFSFFMLLINKQKSIEAARETLKIAFVWMLVRFLQKSNKKVNFSKKKFIIQE